MSGLGDIAGIVLAGGQSRRMGGGDKCLQTLADVPVLSHVIARLGPQVSRMVINANGDPSRFETFGLPVVTDRLSGFQGPLAGVEAGLSWIAAHCPDVSWAVTVPGDTPFIPCDLVARLAAAAESRQAMAVAVSGAGLHPVAALWPVSMAGALAHALGKGERKAGRWVTAQGAEEVFFDAIEVGGTRIDPFFNINRPADLDAARTLLTSPS